MCLNHSSTVTGILDLHKIRQRFGSTANSLSSFKSYNAIDKLLFTTLQPFTSVCQKVLFWSTNSLQRCRTGTHTFEASCKMDITGVLSSLNIIWYYCSWTLEWFEVTWCNFIDTSVHQCTVSYHIGIACWHADLGAFFNTYYLFRILYAVIITCVHQTNNLWVVHTVKCIIVLHIRVADLTFWSHLLKKFSVRAVKYALQSVLSS